MENNQKISEQGAQGASVPTQTVESVYGFYSYACYAAVVSEIVDFIHVLFGDDGVTMRGKVGFVLMLFSWVPEWLGVIIGAIGLAVLWRGLGSLVARFGVDNKVFKYLMWLEIVGGIFSFILCFTDSTILFLVMVPVALAYMALIFIGGLKVLQKMSKNIGLILMAYAVVVPIVGIVLGIIVDEALIVQIVIKAATIYLLVMLKKLFTSEELELPAEQQE